MSESTKQAPGDGTAGQQKDDPDRLLGIYLQDHLGASRGGQALCLLYTSDAADE